MTDEHVLVGGRNGTDPSQTVTAHDPATGAVEWTAPPLGDVASTPAVAGNRGYVGAGTWDGDGARGAVVALDLRSGAESWRHEMEFGASPPVVAGETVFAGTYADAAGPVVALDAADGEVLWTTPLDGPDPTLAATGETLFVGTVDGTVSALRES